VFQKVLPDFLEGYTTIAGVTIQLLYVI